MFYYDMINVKKKQKNERGIAMNQFVKALVLFLCLVTVIVGTVACGGENESEETVDASQGVTESETDSYITSAPVNEEDGWGPVMPNS